MDSVGLGMQKPAAFLLFVLCLFVCLFSFSQTPKSVM
jgi:hypothetical protein